MAKFRKRPVEIEAFLLGEEYPNWWAETVTANKATPHNNDQSWRGGLDYALIQTLEGTMRADKGDWIIRGVKGEIYPCKPDIFALTYEPTDAGQPDAKGDDDEGMMRVGYSLMASIEAYYEHPSMKGWAPADDPAEIVGDLLNIIDEKDVQIAEARNVALDDALKICTSHIEVTKAVLSVASDPIETALCRVRIHTAVLIIDSIRALKSQTDGGENER